MDGERESGGALYSVVLVLGLVGLIGLGLLGLPMTTIIPLAFAAALLWAFVYGLRTTA